MMQLTLFPEYQDAPLVSETKACIKCKKVLPLSDYSFSGGGNYKRTECKKCNNELGKKRREIRDLYGNPPEDYLCPICDRNEEQCQGEGNRKNGAWVVDHDHKTGQFRGWLCHSCNRNIGSFKDNVELLERAIIYLSNVF